MDSRELVSEESKKRISQSIWLQLTNATELANTFTQSKEFTQNDENAEFTEENIRQISAEPNQELGFKYKRDFSGSGSWAGIQKNLVTKEAVAQDILNQPTQFLLMSNESEYRKQEHDAKMEYAKQEYERITEELDKLNTKLTEIKTLLNQEFIQPLEAWVKDHQDTSGLDDDSDSPLATRQGLQTIRHTIDAFSRSVVDVRNINMAQLNEILRTSANLLKLQETLPKNISRPKYEFSDLPMMDRDDPIARKSKAQTSRKYRFPDESEKKYRERTFYDYDLWAELFNKKTLTTTMSQAIKQLNEIKDIKQTETNAAEKIKEKEKIEQQRLAVLAHTEQTNKENLKKNQQNRLKTNDPLFAFYESIRSLKVRELDDIFAARQEYSQIDNPVTQAVVVKKIQEHNAAIKMRLQLALMNFSYELKNHHSEDLKTIAHVDKILQDQHLLHENGKQNSAMFHSMKADFPFSFAYQRLRNQLNKINADKQPIYDAFDIINKQDITEAEKLIQFEEKILALYYAARKKSFNQQIENVLEQFIKHPTGLDLIRKYGVNIPHKIGEKDQPPTLDNPQLKRMAFVALDALVKSNGEFNLPLIDKLKKEYHEIIINNINPAQVADIKSNLQTLDLSARFLVSNSQANSRQSISSTENQSIPEYVEHLRKENGRWNIEFAFFDTNATTLNNLNIPTTSSKETQHTYLIDIADNYSCTKDEKKLAPNYLELSQILEKYIGKRQLEANLDHELYHSIFGRITGMSADVKISAAKKLLAALSNQSYKTITPKEIAALNEGRLREQIDACWKQVPKEFKELLQEKKAPVPSSVKYRREI